MEISAQDTRWLGAKAQSQGKIAAAGNGSRFRQAAEADRAAPVAWSSNAVEMSRMLTTPTRL